MIDRTDFAYLLGLALIVALLLGVTFLAIYVSASRADRMRSTRQRLKNQHWSIRIVTRVQTWERQLAAPFKAAVKRNRSRRRR